ncbi:YgcG family protein [Thermotoga sp. KOL6]|uniref:TPM domain-containing protein n=1 Tax=Thermotoga sp. KOL6 TaxID=126741 RepID=UPI000C762E9C|nr:YgcG family protein [Thermotoga sp. KOL6]PLV59748.1 methanol dehydrogenase [Thermotoga sp. KOL6]
MRRILTILVLSSVLTLFSVNLPKPTPYKYVNDYVGVLDEGTVRKIVAVGKELEEKTTSQVVVVIIPSLSGITIEEYANLLFREWGIGQRDKNNGVLMLIAMNDRKVRIEVGYGLEGTIPDGKAGRILDEYVIPYFKNGEYSKGVYYGYLAIVNEVAKEYNTEISGTEELPNKDSDVSGLSIIIIVLAFIILSSVLGRGGYWYRGPRFPGGFGGPRGNSGGSGGFGGGSSGGGGASRGW